MLHQVTRFDPVKTGYGYLQFDPKNNVYHPGYDLNFGALPTSDLGQPVWAPTLSQVIFVSKPGENGGLGRYVVLYHPKFDVWTRYCHLDGVGGAMGQSLEAGDTLLKGEQFATVGGTGGFSPHLHVEGLNKKGAMFIEPHWRQNYNGYFANLPRAQVAAMTFDVLAWIEHSDDVEPKDWQKEAKEWAMKEEIITSGWDNPTLPMSQERVAAAMKKMWDKLQSK